MCNTRLPNIAEYGFLSVLDWKFPVGAGLPENSGGPAAFGEKLWAEYNSSTLRPF